MTRPARTVRLGIPNHHKTIMKFRILLLLLCSPAALAFEPSVLQGQWAAHQQLEGATDRYFFLTVHADLSGVLVRTRGDQTITRRFDAEDSRTREAYLETDLSGGETAILWAWQQNNGVRRVNGLIFEEGRQEPVRNMLPVPLEYLGPKNELRQNPRISKWARRHPYRDQAGSDD
jgi:hypothetical protein